MRKKNTQDIRRKLVNVSAYMSGEIALRESEECAPSDDEQRLLGLARNIEACIKEILVKDLVHTTEDRTRIAQVLLALLREYAHLKVTVYGKPARNNHKKAPP